MRVLFATSEAYPLIKTGGLADVSGALPKAISQLADFEGDIKLLIPGYSAVLAQLKNAQLIAEIEVLGQACAIIVVQVFLCPHIITACIIIISSTVAVPF